MARGLPLDRVPLGRHGDGPWALVDDDGTLLAVYEGTETDRIRPAVVLAAEPVDRPVGADRSRFRRAAVPPGV